ncbi:TIGR02206 family membrane protein [Streptococcus didelphis]|uniref:TIGR02206 family membrane protein n=1 Tax=Streptococcus didelphis TaxID=102886 RepID=A0ABY9LIU1_9STRE|nr:TIGR02206 family membrane protein [Streptococcus didelphis]WMB28080.1 TIGR02206 family membrane protein [Streptococcus didelphis]WMB29991.1 TIGR02206 family membrane protein [Streptococcus didelphis]
MNFFALKPTEIPQISPAFYALTILLAPLLIVLTLKYYKSSTYRHLFLAIQLSQLITLYGWYFLKGFPLQESLPLYHCRIGMLAVFLFPNKSRIKQLFMLLGILGPILALFSPDFYPYHLLHASNVAFYLGHYALLVNSLIYLLRFYDAELLSLNFMVGSLAVLNFSLIIVNLVTAGNYGFLMDIPIIHTHNLVLNFIIVTSGLVLLAKCVEHVYLRYLTDQGEEAVILSE